MIEPRMDDHLNICRWCDGQVVWATSGAYQNPPGVRFPLDADMDASVEVGTWALTRWGNELMASQPTQGQAAGMRQSGQRLYSHHALTCRLAHEWYKAKDHGKATRKLGTKR